MSARHAAKLRRLIRDALADRKPRHAADMMHPAYARAYVRRYGLNLELEASC